MIQPKSSFISVIHKSFTLLSLIFHTLYRTCEVWFEVWKCVILMAFTLLTKNNTCDHTCGRMWSYIDFCMGKISDNSSPGSLGLSLWWAWQISNHGAIYEQASKTLPWINFPWVDKSIKRFRTWRRALDRNVISADNAFLTKQQIFPLTCPQTKHHSFRLRKHFPNGMASNWKPRDAFCEEHTKG